MKTHLLSLAILLLGSNIVAQDATFTLNNDGNLDYVVTDASDPSLVDAALPAPDPTITLEIGKRYQFTVVNVLEHPLEIIARGANPLFDEVILSTDREGDEGIGELESDSAINWVDGGNVVSFTLTQALADRLALGGKTPGYRCRPHSNAMRGIFTITGGATPTPTATATATPTVTATATPTPTPNPMQEIEQVLTNLNSTNWDTFAVPSVFRAPEFSETGGLSFQVTPGEQTTFGIWQTKENLGPLPSGLYKLTTTLNAPLPAVGQRQPEIRVRVFSADNSQTALTVAAQVGEATFLPGTLETYFKSNGTGEFRIALDIIGALPESGGTVTVSALNLEMVETGHSAH